MRSSDRSSVSSSARSGQPTRRSASARRASRPEGIALGARAFVGEMGPRSRLLVLLLPLVACSSADRHSVYFPITGDRNVDCAAHGAAQRSTPVPRDAATALDELLAGPTPAEANRGLFSPFERSTSDPSAPPLRGHARLAVSNGVATVDV